MWSRGVHRAATLLQKQRTRDVMLRGSAAEAEADEDAADVEDKDKNGIEDGDEDDVDDEEATEEDDGYSCDDSRQTVVHMASHVRLSSFVHIRTNGCRPRL